MMFYIQLLGGFAFLTGGLFFMVMNWGVVIQSLLRRKHSSWVPLFGGLLAAIGIAVLPFPDCRMYWWIPFVVDWGSIPGLFFAIGYIGRQKLTNRQK